MTIPRQSSAVAALRNACAIAWMLARRDLLAEIRTSRLSLLWPLIYPVAYTALFLAIKPAMQSGGPSGMHYAMHVFVGLSLWQLWFQGMQGQMRAIKAQKSLLSRADLDPGTLFLAGFFVQAVHLAPRLLLALVLAVVFVQLRSTWAAGLFLVMAVVVVLNGCVVGFVLQPFATLIPDISRIVQSISLGLVVSAGVFFVLPPTLSDHVLTVLALNPLGPLIEAARAPILGQAPLFHYAPWIWSVLTGLALALQLRMTRKVLPVLLERVGG